MPISVVEGDLAIKINNSFDFSACPYYPIRRRAKRQAAVVFARALVHRARAVDLEGIASWLSQPAIHLALGIRRAPSKRDVCRSQLPDGSGSMESVEFLVLHDCAQILPDKTSSAGWQNALPPPVGFYLIYEARRAHGQEVDFAFSPDFAGMGKPVTVPLLRAGRIATLGYLMAVCGADRVQWVRRRKIPGTSRYRTRGQVRVVTVDRYLSTLRRLENHSEPPSVIECP